MNLVKMAVPVLSLLIVSTSGYPSHKITEKHNVGNVRSVCGAAINAFPSSIKKVHDERQPKVYAAEEGKPQERMIEEDEPPERTTEEDEPPEWTAEDEPPEWAAEEDESPEWAVEEKQGQERRKTEDPPKRIIVKDGQPQTSPVASSDFGGSRDKRAVAFKVPKIRIPSITRLFKPKVRPSAGGSGLGSPSAPAPPKSGSGSRPLGMDSSPPGGKKSRPKSREPNSFPDLDDLSSFDGWDFPDTSRSDSDAARSNGKEEDNKATTEKNENKWDKDRGHSPDYDYHHGWHHW